MDRNLMSQVCNPFQGFANADDPNRNSADAWLWKHVASGKLQAAKVMVAPGKLCYAFRHFVLCIWGIRQTLT